MISEAFEPPFVRPIEKLRLSIQSLKNACDCVMSNWTHDAYEARFYRIPLMPMLMVMDRDALHEVFVTKADNFPQSAIFRRIVKPVWRDGILTSQGEDWRWQRHAAAPAFTPAAAHLVIPHATRGATLLARRWLDRLDTPIDIVPGLADLATHVVFDALLDGGKGANVEEFLAEAELMSAIIGKLNLADIFNLPNWTRRFFGSTLDTPAGALHAYVARVLADATLPATSKRSLLQMLATSTDPETGRQMSSDQLQDNIVGSLSAGRDTTSLTIAWAIYCVARHRPTYDRLVEEIDTVTGGGAVEARHLDQLVFTRAVIMETLRLFPPGPQLARDCIEDTDLQGERVKRGTMILIPIYALHRHKTYWDRPNAFDPDRFMDGRFKGREHRYSYMPFGAGSRICLGMAFALAEAQTVLATLFQSLTFEITDGRPIEFESAVLRSKHGLPMTIRRRTMPRQ